ncbi:uncharacterized protein SCHCODRAFT_02497908 [Schizophyllum commune H4-8]|nr:uncharacterized protein SCHCODRAFT_02497908 [Schizophyllum commune H4-8]KAI5894048.1 hypothetical protein SCHCODRAFT_02497908 [Schizophyllum commune H4-8]
MTSTPREIGTLIVVILKANHLPNKRHIGKQDPYCVVTVNGEKRRTKAIKRGGQHPEWDEEIRFTLYEDTDDILQRTAQDDGTPPPPPPKDNRKGPKKIKGGKSMHMACFADDPREPDLIGETNVDLTEVLTKGETDDWFDLSYKDRFAGKVYLELTFWSNEPPPEKKAAPKVPKTNKEYGGRGSFIPLPEGAPSIAGRPSQGLRTTSLYANPRTASDGSSTIRGSTSLANLDLYVAPYEQPGPSGVDALADDFGRITIPDHQRRESFPNSDGSYIPPRSSTRMVSMSAIPSHHTEGSIYPHGRPLTPPGQASSFQPQYAPPPTNGYVRTTGRGPRYSVPTSSSGFMPLPSSSSFSAGTDSSMSIPPSTTPIPFPSYVSGYAPSPTTAPGSAGPTPSPAPYGSQFATSPSYPYQQYPPPQPPVSAPPLPQQYSGGAQPPLPPPSVPPVAASAPPQGYNAYPPQPPDGSAFASNQGGSRPLPVNPQGSQIAGPQPPYPMQPSAAPIAPVTPMPTSGSYVASQPMPQPPALPTSGSYVAPQNMGYPYQNVPPPPPLSTINGLPQPPAHPDPARRRTSLPVPPGYAGASGFQPMPPPPPTPGEYLPSPHEQPMQPSPPPPPSHIPASGSGFPGPPPPLPPSLMQHAQWAQ